MIDRQKRLIEVYDYLRDCCGVHTKTQFAEILGYGRTSLSAALNGKVDYLTDSLFQNICNRWPKVFNLDYLLSGDGTLLYDKEVDDTIIHEPVVNPTKESQDIDLVKSLLASKNETIEALRQEIKAKDQYIELLKSEYNKLKQSTSHYDHILSDGPLIASEPFPDKE